MTVMKNENEIPIRLAFFMMGVIVGMLITFFIIETARMDAEIDANYDSAISILEKLNKESDTIPIRFSPSHTTGGITDDND